MGRWARYLYEDLRNAGKDTPVPTMDLATVPELSIHSSKSLLLEITYKGKKKKKRWQKR